MTTANGHQYRSAAGLGYSVARFNEKECLQVWGGDVLIFYLFILKINAPTAATSHEFKHIERQLHTYRWMLKL
jgi:hypothetical protein